MSRVVPPGVVGSAETEAVGRGSRRGGLRSQAASGLPSTGSQLPRRESKLWEGRSRVLVSKAGKKVVQKAC